MIPGILTGEEGLRTVLTKYIMWQVTDDTTECISLWALAMEEYSESPLPPEIFQSFLLNIRAQKQILGIYSSNSAEDPAPNKGVTATEWRESV